MSGVKPFLCQRCGKPNPKFGHGYNRAICLKCVKRKRNFDRCREMVGIKKLGAQRC